MNWLTKTLIIVFIGVVLQSSRSKSLSMNDTTLSEHHRVRQPCIFTSLPCSNIGALATALKKLDLSGDCQTNIRNLFESCLRVCDRCVLNCLVETLCLYIPTTAFQALSQPFVPANLFLALAAIIYNTIILVYTIPLGAQLAAICYISQGVPNTLCLLTGIS